MKRIFITTMAAVLMCSVFAAAQEKEPTAKHRPRAGQSQVGLFQRADADKDGKVTLAELQVVAPKMTAERFKKLDKDASGALTKEEVPARSIEQDKLMLKKADADQDGQVTFEEMKKVAPKMKEARFGELDRNDDGVLTPADFPNAGKAGPDRGELRMKLKSADKDGNGEVTFDEAQAVMPKITREKFDKLDQNHDGVVSKADHGPKKAGKKAEKPQ